MQCKVVKLLMFIVIGCASDAPEPISNESMLCIYDVGVLVDYAIEFVTLLPNTSEKAFTEYASRDKIRAEELVVTIKTKIAPGRWVGKACWSIEYHDGLLVVRAPQHIQDSISQYIEDQKYIIQNK